MSYLNQDNDFSQIEFSQSPNISQIAKKNPLSIIIKNISNNLKKPQVASKMTQEQDAQLLSQIKMQKSLVFQNKVEQQYHQNNMEQSLKFANDVPTQKINQLNPINSSVKKFSNVQQQQQIPQPQTNDKKGWFNHQRICQKENQQYSGQLTKIQVIKTNQQLQDYFADYELNLEAAILLNYLSQQASCGIFDKQEEKQIRFFQYIVKLQGLYLIFNKQQHRMNNNIYTKQKYQLISKEKQLLYSIYQQLKMNNKQINSEFKSLYNFASFKILIQKKLGHPNKIYTIFTTQEIQKVYFDVLAIVYKKVYSILKEKHTELHLRLSLLILISMKFKQIFNLEELEQSFRIFYTERKVIRRDRIEANQLIQYIIESNSRVILKHHKELRKKFQIYQQ